MGQKEGIHLAKDLAVDICEEIIKIIIHGGIDEEAMPSDVADVNSKVDDWFKKVWAKITKFFQDLGEKIKKAFKQFGIDMKDFGKKIKEAFDRLGKKIKAFFDKAFPVEIRNKIKAMFEQYGKAIV